MKISIEPIALKHVQDFWSVLMEAALADTFEKGLSRIELGVFASNTSAIVLYEKLDFVHEGCKRKARFVDDNWDDMLIMGLLKEEYKKQ